MIDVPKQATAKPIVLAVDDESHILSALKRYLRRQGFSIRTATNGRDALEVLRNENVAVLICDQRMPEMMGSEVLAAAVDIRPDTYRITLTGYTDLQAAQDSINHGSVHQFLTKPWQDDQLLGAVTQGVQSFQMLRENQRLQALTKQQNEELENWNRELESKVEVRTAELAEKNELLESLREDAEESLRDTVGLLSSLLEMTNPATGLRSKRVARLAGELGGLLDLPAETVRHLQFAGELHDLGRIVESVSASATGKRSSTKRVTPEQRAESGAGILSRIRGFDAVAEGVRLHTERFDGKGAQKVRGTDIPVISRILAVASAYDQAVFDPKKPTVANRKAGRAALADEANHSLDPDLVRLLIDSYADELEGDGVVEVSPAQIRPGMVLAEDLKANETVLLIKAETKLTRQLVERIKVWSTKELLLRGIHVQAFQPEELDCEEDVEIQEGDKAQDMGKSEAEATLTE